MTNRLLIVFTKNLIAGKVKTRLAKTIGDQSALKAYEFLLNHTQNLTEDIVCDRQVGYAEHIVEEDIWAGSRTSKFIQNGSDLGERMSRAFKDGFKAGYDHIILIGSDCFELQSKHLDSAFRALNEYDVVIGPARDGGYYLIGMSDFRPELFLEQNWGTSAVLKQTLHQINNEDVFLLDELNDIDNFDDLKENQELLELLNINDKIYKSDN
ncbi:MAG: TIGR04282 family arsenosugar biosynthesis glycosyltransferase [Bacteroidia bacterium]|nr:TIGR04282 family arsenosugar biosynthesis glycosyltransferase [Bacteroidia bacterium]